jgi:predicted phage terminase large subunit-like protein
MFDKDWFKILPSNNWPESFDKTWAAWDLTFGDTPDADETVGMVFGLSGGKTYILDMVHGQMNFLKQLDAIVALSQKWTPMITVIENKANGTAAINMLRMQAKDRGIRPPIPWASATSKINRIASAALLVEVDSLHLPEGAKWIPAFLSQLEAYPNTKNDDRADCLSIGLLYGERKFASARKKGRAGGILPSNNPPRPTINVQQTVNGVKYGGATGRPYGGGGGMYQGGRW